MNINGSAVLEASTVWGTTFPIDRNRELQHFEQIGRAAAGIAHDFNNFILGISGAISEVHEELGPQSPHRPILEMALRAADKARNLSKRLLSLGRDSKSAWQEHSLNSVIGEMSSIMQQMVGPDIQLVLNLDPSLGKVKGDSSQIEQVILNLATNARDAMPTGGELKIETSPNERFIQLKVSDTGIGMDPYTLHHAFEPFFTTKAAKGTGIGLATLKTIVEDHGGSVSVVSQPRQGTVFTVLWPRV